MNENGLVVLVITFPFLIYLLYWGSGKLIETRRIKSLWHEPFPPEFSLKLQNSFPPYGVLSDEEKQKLHFKILYFLRFKKFIPLGNFEVSESMKLIIAAQACLLILNLENGIYPSLKRIYLSATPFIEKENALNMQTMLPAHVPRLGESWLNGPIVLAWSSVKEGIENWKDGHNVVLHEFTHQLDARTGSVNGIPPLENYLSYKKWQILMSQEFMDLRDKVNKHRKSDIDTYGATNGAEFFAVTVEYFFEKSVFFKQKHPELFELYLSYFQINPIRWSDNVKK